MWQPLQEAGRHIGRMAGREAIVARQENCSTPPAQWQLSRYDRLATNTQPNILLFI